MGLFVLNSFAQLNKLEEGTPAFTDYVVFSLKRYKNILRKQLYLQNHGVSFDYTDKLSYKQIDDLIEVCQELDEEMKEQFN